MTKKVPLTKGAFASVDDVDYHRIMAVGSWCLTQSGYAVHWYTDPQTGKRKALYMHRFIMDATPDLQVDHINRDRLNNTRANLRFATRSQNQANKALQSNNSSLFKGVVWNQGKWESRIYYARKKLHLGRFESAERAALHYDAAARLIFGDFAAENFPERETQPDVERAVKAKIATIAQKRGLEAFIFSQVKSATIPQKTTQIESQSHTDTSQVAS